MNCYAGWNPDAAGRKKSASGGVATLLARTVLQEGGVYFGTRWDAQLHPVIAWTEDDVTPFQGSRYVQAAWGNARKELETFLAQGRTVFFVGTPCQVASLKTLRKQYPGLLCADLLCHGTAPERYLEEELAYLSHGRALSDVRFREGGHFALSLWKGEQCLHRQEATRSPYLWGYLSGITLREACYHCPFARLEREGDLTLGDFIGIERENVSFILSHTPAGEALLQRCGAVLEPRSLEERLGYRPAILEPTQPAKERAQFLRLLERFPFPVAIRRCLRKHFLTLPFRQLWKWLHHQAHLLRRRA